MPTAKFVLWHCLFGIKIRDLTAMSERSGVSQAMKQPGLKNRCPRYSPNVPPLKGLR